MDFSAISEKCFSGSTITASDYIQIGSAEPRLHCTSILNDLNEQRINHIFCDAALHCRGKVVHAHRCVLSCASRYFRTLFTTPLSPTAVHVVNMEEYSSVVVQLLVELIYTQVDIPYTSLVELLKLAVFVHYDGLVKLLVATIRPLINDSSVLHWLDVAHQCGCEDLIWLTECFVKEDYAKLHWKAMMEESNVKDILNYVRNSKIRRRTKDVVHILAEKRSALKKEVKEEFIMDVEKKLISVHHPENGTPLGSMLDPNIFPSLKSTFVRNGVIFAVFSKLNFITGDTVVDLLKYRHTSNTLERARTYRIGHSSSFLAFSFYDGKDNLYLQIHNECKEQLFKKIDLITGLICEGHVNMGPRERKYDYCEYPMLFCIDHGMYYISLDTIAKISDFNFDQTENKVDEIRLAPRISGLDSVSNALKSEQMIYFQSCNGIGYCVLPPKHWSEEKYNILKLDLQKLSWEHIADFECSYVTNVLSCNNVMYVVCSMESGDDNPLEVHFFNEITMKFEDIGLKIDCSYARFFNFPVYF